MKRKNIQKIKKKPEKKNVNWNEFNKIVKILELNSNNITEFSSKGKINETDEINDEMKLNNTLTLNKNDNGNNTLLNISKEHADESKCIKNFDTIEENNKENI